ncbi:MAG TPA: hypothetical protein ENH26_00380 [Candidatus Wolfebacteria bacterium]|nr:hypothetical protein [Candidatus Wolfebacteria bacterium]
MRKKLLFWLILIIILFGSGLYFIFSDSYPVVLVNYRIISARDFEKDYTVAIHYYQSLFKAYAEDPTELNSKEIKLEIRQVTLDKLIENQLIHKKLKELIGANDLQNMVDNKIKEIIKKSSNIQKGVELVYGLSLADFKERILIPQAEREILEGQLFFNGEKIDEWLKEIKSVAKVIVLIPGFAWDGEKITIK